MVTDTHIPKILCNFQLNVDYEYWKVDLFADEKTIISLRLEYKNRFRVSIVSDLYTTCQVLKHVNNL